jgi:type II secretory pathway pseudopilin PulG
MKKKLHKKNLGFTILEILIAISIIILFSSIVAPLLTDAKDKNVTVQAELTMVKSSFENIYSRHINSNINDEFDNKAVIQGKMLAVAYRKNSSFDVFNLFGGKINISSAGDNSLIWESNGINAEACPSYVDSAKHIGFDSVEVGSTTITYSSASVVNINQACINGTDADGKVTVTFLKDVPSFTVS